MKRIGIITFHCVENLGAVLQCVALYYYLTHCGYEVQVINYCPDYLVKQYPLFVSPFSALNNYHGSLKIKSIVKQTVLNVRMPFLLIKKIAYYQFLKNTIQFSRKCTEIKELDRLPSYDFYIAGSDQIWNKACTGGKLDLAYFLSFAKGPKISYAASAGSVLDTPDIQNVLEQLSRFSNISVRESKLQEQLKKMGLESACLVADPTLLVAPEVWRSLEKNPRGDRPFILVYCLEYNKKIEDLMDSILSHKKIDVIDISPRNFIRKQWVTKHLRYCTPRHFLGLIDHAECVITNSFHGTIFSLIMNTKFATVLNTKYPNRVENLLSELNLTSRIFDGDTESMLNELKKQMSCEQKQALAALRYRSELFLKNALKNEGMQ